MNYMVYKLHPNKVILKKIKQPWGSMDSSPTLRSCWESQGNGSGTDSGAALQSGTGQAESTPSHLISTL